MEAKVRGTTEPDTSLAPNPAALWQGFVPDSELLLAQELRPKRPTTLDVDGSVALLVVDVVTAFVGSQPRPLREAVREYRTSCGERGWAALPAIYRLLEDFRRTGSLIVFTRPDTQISALAGPATTMPVPGLRSVGLTGGEFPEEVQPQPDELVLPKARASAFFETPLPTILSSQGIRSVLVVGGTTSGCVRATVVDAVSHGLQAYVAADACFDRYDISHAVSLFDIHAKYGDVLTSEEIQYRGAAG